MKAIIILALAVVALALSSCATSYKHPATTAADDQAIIQMFR